MIPKRLRARIAEHAARGIPHDPGAPALVLSPHLDDAVLGCWTVLDAPGRVEVVNVFAGLPSEGPPSGWDRLTGAAERRSRMVLRREEDRAALALAGRRASNLDLLEADYRSDRRLMVVRILRALAGNGTSACCVYAPLGLGGHSDHCLVRDAALALARRGMPLRLYAELPYALRYGWPTWVSGRAGPEYLVPEVPWDDARAQLPWATCAQVERLEAGGLERKLAALRCYRTQLPALDGAGMRWLGQTGEVSYEVFFTRRNDGESPNQGG